MKINCTKCGQPVDMPAVPQPQTMNTSGASLILLEHPKPGFCLTCKVQVAIVLQSATLNLVAAPVVTAKEPPLIVAPAAALSALKNGKS
jgi:hypothetical protein